MDFKTMVKKMSSDGETNILKTQNFTDGNLKSCGGVSRLKA
jgi:hypothetical protein